MMEVSWPGETATLTGVLVAWCDGDAIILHKDQFYRITYTLLTFVRWFP